MRKVAVLGWYGHGNFGDELILEGLRTLFRGWQVQVFSNDGWSAYPLIDFDRVNRCDLFVLGGGELINGRWLWMPAPCMFKPRTRAYRLYARTPFSRRSWINRVEPKKVILGCGVDAENPMQIGANVVRDLEQFDYIGLRDLAAVKILSGFPTLKPKVHLFHDLAFAVDLEQSTLSHLARLFPIKLHGLVLAHMAGVPYTFKPYHRKVQRVHETINGLTLEQIRADQRKSFREMMQKVSQNEED